MPRRFLPHRNEIGFQRNFVLAEDGGITEKDGFRAQNDFFAPVWWNSYLATVDVVQHKVEFITSLKRVVQPHQEGMLNILPKNLESNCKISIIDTGNTWRFACYSKYFYVHFVHSWCGELRCSSESELSAKPWRRKPCPPFCDELTTLSQSCLYQWLSRNQNQMALRCNRK